MRDPRAIEWLLRSPEPAVRYLSRRDLLGEEAADDRARVLDGPWVRALLDGQQPDGGFGADPYRKWTGAFWRAVSLVELAVPAGHPPTVAAARTVIAWVRGRYRKVPVVAGRARVHATAEGNALGVCTRLGLAAEVAAFAGLLVRWQWPDGGWNCDPRPAASHSSFHETLAPLWGLHEYAAATGDAAAECAAGRAAELLLTHRVFRASSTGEVVHPSWVALHYPPYWHYDVLQAALVLVRAGHAADPRLEDALDVLGRRRLADGRWRAGGRWWQPPGSPHGQVEVVDWGRRGANPMITLNALRVLRAAGRVDLPS